MIGYSAPRPRRYARGLGVLVGAAVAGVVAFASPPAGALTLSSPAPVVSAHRQLRGLALDARLGSPLDVQLLIKSDDSAKSGRQAQTERAKVSKTDKGREQAAKQAERRVQHAAKRAERRVQDAAKRAERAIRDAAKRSERTAQQAAKQAQQRAAKQAQQRAAKQAQQRAAKPAVVSPKPEIVRVAVAAPAVLARVGPVVLLVTAHPTTAKRAALASAVLQPVPTVPRAVADAAPPSVQTPQVERATRLVPVAITEGTAPYLVAGFVLVFGFGLVLGGTTRRIANRAF